MELTFIDIESALQQLDILEGTASNPPLYNRITTTTASGVEVWVYTYGDADRCLDRLTRDQSAILIPSGVWVPQSDEEGLYP